MALIRKASAMGCLSQLRAFTQHPLGKIDPSVLQITIRTGAKQCPEVTRLQSKRMSDLEQSAYTPQSRKRPRSGPD
jgi:hypothetical protein